jgi:hypothetical protein
MAILRNGPNGGLTGKFGSVIGYKLNGQDIIKGLPKKRTSGPTVREQANREKFALLQAWLQPITDVLRIGFKGHAPTFQGFVAAKSYNSKHALKQKEDGTPYVDPALAVVSYGTISLPKTMTMERQGNEIIATWENGSHYDPIDQAILLAYDPENSEAEYDLAAAKRSTGRAVLALPDHFESLKVHVYLAFVAYDHSAQSNSYYLGSLQNG